MVCPARTVMTPSKTVGGATAETQDVPLKVCQEKLSFQFPVVTLLRKSPAVWAKVAIDREANNAVNKIRNRVVTCLSQFVVVAKRTWVPFFCLYIRIQRA